MLNKPKPIPSLDQRSIASFMKRVMPEPNTGCWIWTGGMLTNGYPKFYMKGKEYYAHRVSHAIHGGEMREDRILDHLCRNTWCVNPDHLESVTYQQNVLRGASPIAKPDTNPAVLRNRLATSCRKGHPYTEENTYLFYRNGRPERVCKTCKRDHKFEKDWEKRLKSNKKRRKVTWRPEDIWK